MRVWAGEERVVLGCMRCCPDEDGLVGAVEVDMALLMSEDDVDGRWP